VSDPAGHVSVERVGHFTTSGEVVTADFTLPVSVVRGTVTQADGYPVPWPNVFVTRHAPDEATYFPSWRNDEGQYIVLGVPVGTFEVTAQDDVGVTATVSGEIVDLASSVTVDVTLPATGVVSGAVRNADGTPAAGAEVRLAGGSLNAALATTGSRRWVLLVLASPPGPGQRPGLPVGRRPGVCDRLRRRRSDSFDVDLPATGTVVVRAVWYDGTPITTASLSFEGVTCP
jgi:hypothetical protein